MAIEHFNELQHVRFVNRFTISRHRWSTMIVDEKLSSRLVGLWSFEKEKRSQSGAQKNKKANSPELATKQSNRIDLKIAG